ncbi:MAG: 3'-5' exonuclease [Opitutales bacterium]
MLQPFPRSISKAEINELPLIRFTERVHLVTTGAALQLAVRRLSQEQLLGFDTESRPSFRKGQNFPVSLVQLAGSEGVYLIQLGRVGNLSALVPLLENPAIIKAGVALHDDVRRLREVVPFEAGGFAEVSDLSRDLGVENTGLRPLAALFMNGRISKGAQLSNWAKPRLSRKQIIYAATDAWVSRELYRIVAGYLHRGTDPDDGLGDEA